MYFTISIYGEAYIFLIDNSIEFKNKDIKGYLELKDIKFINRRPNHRKSQGVVKVFNKTIQDCYENDKINDIEWNLRLTLSEFLNFYNQKRKLTTANRNSIEVIRKSMIK